jgi:transposase-like protein
LPSQWKSARTTNAIQRLHEQFKRRIKTGRCCRPSRLSVRVLRALLASGQITMRKVDGWQILAETADQPIQLVA